MRFGNADVRPAGGTGGCFAMIMFSLVASVALTIALNLLLRL